MTSSTHLRKYPHARGSSIAQKQLEDAVLAQLRKEIADMNSRPKSESKIRAMLRGIARLVGRAS